MDSTGDKIKRFFQQSNICVQIICINGVVYLLYSFIHIVCLLFKSDVGLDSAIPYLELPSNLNTFLHQPWSIISYMFLHIDFLHILFNMLWLYWFGQLFLNVYSSRHFLGLYILGGIGGGLFYMLAYNIFPYFDDVVSHSYLLGASASVLAIVVATAVREPNYRVNLFLLGAVRLKYIALFSVVISFLFIGSNNAGGNIAHLGGAFIGWLFAFLLTKGHDITAWINAIFNFLATITSKTHRPKKPKMKAHVNERARDYDYNAQKKAQENEINRILEKIKRSGYQNLTEEEKKKLFDAGRK